MKAWEAYDRFEGACSAVIFAETRGKAHSMAMSIFDQSEWNDITVVRLKEMDKYYKEGKTMMEWDDDNDRIALCKNGWWCFEPDNDECQTCAAHDFCGWHKDMRGEEDG